MDKTTFSSYTCINSQVIEKVMQLVSIDTSISHTKKVVEGDVLTASAKELDLTKRTGIYQVEITNQNNEIVALFRGTVYRTAKEWEV